jgi:cell division protein FtsQ
MQQERKISYKKMLKLVLWGLIIILFFIVSFFAIQKRNILRVHGLEFSIRDKKGNFFVNDKDIENEIKKIQPMYIGTRLKDVNLQQMEAMVNENEYIEKADIVAKPNGVLKIFVSQKNPIARVVNSGQSYYISDQWQKVPLSSKFTKRVPLIIGNTKGILFPTTTEDSFRKKQVFTILNYAKENEFWNLAIDQIYIAPDNKIELILIFSEAIIQMGYINEDFEKRLEKVKNFFKIAVKNVDITPYKILNFQYEQQVIAIK